MAKKPDSPEPTCDGEHHIWREEETEEGWKGPIECSCSCGATKSVEKDGRGWLVTTMFEPPKTFTCKHGKTGRELCVECLKESFLRNNVQLQPLRPTAQQVPQGPDNGIQVPWAVPGDLPPGDIPAF